MNLNPKQILQLQQEAELNAAVKSGKTGTRLLDDSDNNIGNSQTLNPIILPIGLGAKAYATQPSSEKNWLLNLRANSKSGQSVTVVMTAARKEDTPGFVGPITGVIEFGNGSTFTSIEFDIPVGPFVGSPLAVLPATQPQDGGAVIQVPSSIIRAYARYNNALLQTRLDGTVFGEPGTLPVIAPNQGPFAPNSTSNDPAAPTPGRPIAPVFVKAFASYFGRHYTKLYKTQYLFVGSTVALAPFSGLYAIPPFAKSVRVVRVPQTSIMELRISDGLAHPNASLFAGNPPNFEDIYTIPAGPSAAIPLDGNASLLFLSGVANPGDNVSGVKLVYEIGF